MSYTPATATDYLLELGDDELIEITGATPDSRAKAMSDLSAATDAAYGSKPDEDALVRVVDTLVKYDLIAPADEATKTA
jgi:hypothetical protein